MGLTVTKKVRLSEDDARRLADIATRRDMTESDVLREGLELVAERDDLVRRRRRHLNDLLAYIDDPDDEPPKRSWRMPG